MEVEFRDKKLHRCSEDESFGRKKLGEERYRKYMQRIGDLLAADSLEDVRNIPGRYHELIGDRKGQWACDLDHPYRLIFRRIKDRFRRIRQANTCGLRLLR